MEIIINGTNISDIATKSENIDEVQNMIIEQLSRISAGFFKDDAIVKLSNSEKNLGTTI